MVDMIEGKKKKTRNIMNKIERATNKMTNTLPDTRGATWIGKLEQWRKANVLNQLTEEEDC